VKEIVDLTQSIMENGFNNPAFDDGRIDVCMTHETVGWHAEVYTAATHIGTHVDAPLHKLKGGKPLSAYPPERLFGKGVFIDLFHKNADEEITEGDLLKYGGEIEKGCIVILCTGWQKYRTEKDKEKYLFHSPWLGSGGAEYLAAEQIGAVGIDHFSVGGTGPEAVVRTHEILLGADILIIEGLVVGRELLRHKDWEIIASPLLLPGCSGAPARVFAVRQK
jgi:arylformamidase